MKVVNQFVSEIVSMAGSGIGTGVTKLMRIPVFVDVTKSRG